MKFFDNRLESLERSEHGSEKQNNAETFDRQGPPRRRKESGAATPTPRQTVLREETQCEICGLKTEASEAGAIGY